MVGELVFEDGTKFEGASFGAPISSAGEVVFSTGMVGYPESLTDPSYLGQILILTYPIIGNYGVFSKKYWESDSMKISGLIVSNYIDTPSHFQSQMTLSEWLKESKVPALEIKDTRMLTQKLRTKGTMLGKILLNKDVEFYDPNKENLVSKVSIKKVSILKPLASQGETLQGKTILLIDCGAKGNIESCLLKRNINVITVPWDFDPFSEKLKFEGILISNGPGDPKKADKTIKTIKKAMELKIPILGICLGNQILALAGGGDTYKLKFGHRSQNQPCILEDSQRPARHASQHFLPSLTIDGFAGIAGRCFITTQNHSFAVGKIPKGFKTWFTNANDGSNEGIIHKTLPFMSVQFHPEACPGPTDAEWIFDYFLKKI